MAGRINLVPAQERKRSKTDVGLLLLIVAAVVVIGGIGYAYYHYSSTLSDKEAELADIQAQNQQVQAQLASLSAFDELQARVDTAEQTIQSIYAGRTLVADIMGDVSLVMPERAWFKTLNVTTPDPPVQAAPGTPAPTNQTAGLGELTVTGNTYTFEDVADLLVRLELIPGVEAVTLSTAGDPALGSFDEKKQVLGYQAGGEIVNTQSPDTPLPLTQVEVQAQ